MRKRSKIGFKKSRKIFKRTANRIHKKNLTATLSRGGICL